MKKALLIYNPKSGSGMFKNNLDLIVDSFQKNGFLLIPVRGTGIKHLNEMLKQAKIDQYDKIIAAGGDGTINVVVNAMIRNDINIPLAIFPAGTANDFAYYFDISHEIDKMIQTALGDRTCTADVGCANGQYFINVAAMGCLVDLSQRTDPNMKNTLGVLSYYLRGMVELPNLHGVKMRFESEEFTGEESVYFTLVMNGKSAGGFKQLATTADIDDGYLDVLLFKEVPPIDFLPLVFSILAGQHQENKNVIYFRTNKIKIDTDDQTIGIDVDGESGSKFPLDISVLPSRLRVITNI